MGFQQRSERLNGVLLLDALGEDIPEGGNDISEDSLAVRLVLEPLGPGTSRVLLRCSLPVCISQCELQGRFSVSFVPRNTLILYYGKAGCAPSIPYYRKAACAPSVPYHGKAGCPPSVPYRGKAGCPPSVPYHGKAGCPPSVPTMGKPGVCLQYPTTGKPGVCLQYPTWERRVCALQ